MRRPAELDDADRDAATLVVIPLELHIKQVHAAMQWAREGCLIFFGYGVWLGALVGVDWPPPFWLSLGPIVFATLILAREKLRRVLW